MSVASSYAKALLEVAVETSLSVEDVDTIEEEMSSFASTLSQSKEARVALLGAVTSQKEKIFLIDQICQQFKLTPLLAQFLGLLAKKGRLALLREIGGAFHTLRLASEGQIAGELVSAERMNETDVAILGKAFSEKLGKKVVFRLSTDPWLLAGLKVTVNGVTYDGTLRSQLQKLREQLTTGVGVGSALAQR